MTPKSSFNSNNDSHCSNKCNFQQYILKQEDIHKSLEKLSKIRKIHTKFKEQVKIYKRKRKSTDTLCD